MPGTTPTLHMLWMTPSQTNGLSDDGTQGDRATIANSETIHFNTSLKRGAYPSLTFLILNQGLTPHFKLNYPTFTQNVTT